MQLFFLSFSLSVLPSIPHTTLRETAPLWPHLPKPGSCWGGEKQNKLGNFFKMDLRVSAHPCASLGTITPLFHFKFNNCTSSLKNMLKITHPCSEFSQKRCLLTKPTFCSTGKPARTKTLLVFRHFWEISVHAFQQHR